MVIARIASADATASSAPFTTRMPPDFPRLPAGIWAFTTQGPNSSNAARTSAGAPHTIPLGTSIPAARRTRSFAECSSKFISFPLAAVFRPVRTEQLFFAGPVFGNGRHEMSNIKEVFVVQVFRNRIFLPTAAAHAERKIQPGIEAPAI